MKTHLVVALVIASTLTVSCKVLQPRHHPVIAQDTVGLSRDQVVVLTRDAPLEFDAVIARQPGKPDYDHISKIVYRGVPDRYPRPGFSLDWVVIKPGEYMVVSPCRFTNGEAPFFTLQTFEAGKRYHFYCEEGERFGTYRLKIKTFDSNADWYDFQKYPTNKSKHSGLTRASADKNKQKEDR